jgi:hypothetical protein
MPFSHLLFEALLPGQTLAEDKRRECQTSADLKRGPNETILLFRLDQDSTRSRLGLSDRKCCDHLYFLKSATRTMLIFVELKSTNLDEAENQILNAHNAICKHSNVKNQSFQTVALVVSRKGTPQNVKKRQSEMRKRGIHLYFGISRRGTACAVRNVINDLS